MSDRFQRISRILTSHKSRTAYIKAKLAVLVPAQIRALRLRSNNPPMPHQKDLAKEAEMQQSRISMFETPGEANITLATLAKVAAALRLGVIVKFVPFHEMLRWENEFLPDGYDVRPRLEEDEEFLNPSRATDRPSLEGAAGDFGQYMEAARRPPTPAVSGDPKPQYAELGG
jgi:transcriptional regulator with XRE-family HTH domain